MIQGMEHVGIVVSDMERSLQFYTSIFDLQLRKREQLSPQVELAFLFHPNHPGMELELIARENGSREEGIVSHLAFRVNEIEGVLQKLIDQGVKVSDTAPRVIFGDVKIAFFEGPDGEKLELVER